MSVVYTIGYEDTDIDRFVDTLKAVGVRTLADVRAVALSRKKGFSKAALRNRLAEEGIVYRHFAELGDPKPGREAARAGHHDKFRKIYAKHLTSAEAKSALDTLAETTWSSPSCLLCFERDPKLCHRSIVADKLRLLGLEVFDLFGDIPARYVNHATKFPRHHSRESTATA